MGLLPSFKALVIGVGAAVGVVTIGIVAATSPVLAVTFAATLMVAAVGVRFPAIVLVAVLPAAYAWWRVGPEITGLSLADASLLVGAFAAAPFVPWTSPKLRRALAGLATYEAMLALAIVAHPSRRAVIECGHRLLLVGGSLMVGAALVRQIRLRLAINLYLGASAFIAVNACLYTVTHGLEPAYPLGIQKNAAGLLLSCAFLMTVIAPRFSSLPVGLINPLRVLLLVGTLATQSRSAMLAATVVLAAVQLRSGDRKRSAALVVAAALAMSAVAVIVTQKQDLRARSDPSSARFYGIGARQSVNDEALKAWSHERLLGAGLRYFRDPVLATSEPHNVVIVSLAESGIVGLTGLVLLLGAGWSALRGRHSELSTLARAAFAVQIIAGMFDIYWVAGRGSLAWVLIGAAISAHAARPSTAEAVVA